MLSVAPIVVLGNVDTLPPPIVILGNVCSALIMADSDLLKKQPHWPLFPKVHDILNEHGQDQDILLQHQDTRSWMFKLQKVTSSFPC